MLYRKSVRQIYIGNIKLFDRLTLIMFDRFSGKIFQQIYMCDRFTPWFSVQQICKLAKLSVQICWTNQLMVDAVLWGSRGKGSYKFKHEALISSGSYLLNDEKGNQEKAPISCCVFVSGDGGRAHNKRCQKNTTKKTHFLALKPTLSIRWFLIARNPPTHSESKLCDNKNHMINSYYPLLCLWYCQIRAAWRL